MTDTPDAAAPAPGDRVLYTLDAEDAAGITSRRDNFQLHQAHGSGHKHPHPHGGSGAPGYVAHVGLPVAEGQEYPADVVVVAAGGRLGLRVLLPGSDVQWVTGVTRGDGPGCWRERP